MMTTLLCRHPEQHLQKSRFARFLQYFRDVGPSHIVTNCNSGLCELDIGLCEGFRQKLEIGWGEACFCAVFKVLWSCRSPLLTTVL